MHHCSCFSHLLEVTADWLAQLVEWVQTPARPTLRVFKVHLTQKFVFISLFERAFKMVKNSVYFIVIALLVAELFKILIYAN